MSESPREEMRTHRKSHTLITLAIVGAGFILAASVALSVVLWTWGYAPSDFPQAANAPTASTARTERRAGRILRHVTLLDARLGKIGFAVSLPDPAPRCAAPVVFVLGALGTGEHSIGLIHEPGRNAVVDYDWPRLPRRLGPSALPALRSEALSIPGQVTAISRWVVAQPWADAHRVTLVGFSLGAIATPAVEHVLLAQDMHVQWTVLADGGAPISAVIGGDQHIRPPWLRSVAAFVGELLLRPLDPALHVSQLKGHFLLISSADDTTISAAASERLAQLTPPPKQIVRMPGGHVGTAGAKIALLNAAITATRRWLIAQGAINASSRGSPL
jgi:hypothetical protein